MVVVFQGERVDGRVHPQTLTYRDAVASRPRDSSLIPLLSLHLRGVTLALLASNILLNVLVKVVLIVVRNV